MEKSTGMNTTDGNKGIFWGWLVVAGAFVILGMSYGARYCFGVFLKPMFAEYQWQLSVISLGASINLFMYAAGGILSGWLLDRMAPRWIMTIGALVTGLGFILTSFMKTPGHLYISYGILCGLGSAGIGVVVCSSSVGKWFIRKRGVAVGIASMGIGMGTMIFTPLTGYIVKHYDWRDGFMFFGILICTIGIAVSQILMRKTRPEAYGLLPDGRRAAVNPGLVESAHGEDIVKISPVTVLKNFRFWVLVVCFGVAVMAEMMAFVHQISYAINLGVERIAAASSVGVIGIASIFGRFFFGWFSDRIRDPKYSAFLGFLFMSAGMLILWKMTTLTLLYVYAFIFGFGYGSLAPMMPILIADRFGRHILGAAYGWLTFFVVGFGGSLGPIIGGFVYDSLGSHQYAWQFNMIALLIVAFVVLFLKPGDVEKA